jgi:hypothetical protein
MDKFINNILLIEGRKEDAYKRYVSNLEEGPLKGGMEAAYDIFINNDPSGNHKYIGWLMKQGLANMKVMLTNLLTIDGDEEEYMPDVIIDIVTRYHNNIQRMTKKDINQYTSVSELLKDVEEIESKTTRKQEKLKGAEKIYEDDHLLVVTPKTQKGSCYYGANTRWCVAARNEHHFDNYSRDGILYYLIWKPQMPHNMSQYQKIARYIPHGNPYGTEGEYYDSVDDRTNNDNIEANIFGAEWDDYSEYPIIPNRARPYYDSWDSAKIKIDTHYAKNGMDLANTRGMDDWGDDDWDDYDDWD